jgi:uncharacterized FAD-dependent dehydrogenase
MQKELDLVIQPHRNNIQDIKQVAAHTLKIDLANITSIRLLKRSLDARKKRVIYRVKVMVYIDEKPIGKDFKPNLKDVNDKKQVVIIGAGPAGLFAGIRAIELGLKPIIFDRGKNVKSRRRDLAEINKEHKVNPESNYCFGEGGAGTYSDGKLYTRSKKRGEVSKILETFVAFGAEKDILADAHPHIGTNKLPQIIVAMREAILENGGEVNFDSKITDIIVENNKVEAVEINGKRILKADNVILATGHSARDIYYMLFDKKIKIEFKPFALGVRIEHPQDLIDSLQYSCNIKEGRGEFLPPSSYSLVAQTKHRGVFSFCMCPGGIIAPCATNQEEVVTNGWSPSKRNNPYANSGIVTQVEEGDVKEFKKFGPLKGLKFQEAIERTCWEAGGKTQAIPAQRLVDFIQDKTSEDLPKSSYIPGIKSVNLNDILPEFVTESLKQAFLQFDKKMTGYLTNEAVLHAPESRTSSPVRIPRDKDTFEHVEVKGLYPCGEGAGYAGGIVSAAIDGQKCIEKIVGYEAPKPKRNLDNSKKRFHIKNPSERYQKDGRD